MVEILLPPGQTHVRAPEGDEGRPAGEQPGDGGELALLFGQQLIAVEHQPQIPEAFRGGGLGQQVQVLPHPVPVLLIRKGQKCLRRHLQGHRMEKILPDQPREIQIAQLR